MRGGEQALSAADANGFYLGLSNAVSSFCSATAADYSSRLFASANPEAFLCEHCAVVPINL